MTLTALKGKALLIAVAAIVILVVGTVAVLTLMPKEQDVRQQASQTTGTVLFRVNPATLALAPGEKKTVTVQMKSGTTEFRDVSVALEYEFTGTNPLTINASSFRVSSLFPTTSYNCATAANKVETVGNKTSIEFSCQHLGGASPVYPKTGPDFADVFSFDITAGSTPTTQDIVLAFNSSKLKVIDPTKISSDTELADIAATPTTDLKVKITQPVVAKDITIALADLTCTDDDFTVTATFKEGATPKSGVEATFLYNDVELKESTGTDGAASVSYTKATTNKNVTVSALGWTSKNMTVALPTNCDDDDDDDADAAGEKEIQLSLAESLSCGDTSFTVDALATDGTDDWQDVQITFTYNNQQKQAYTDSSGEASVSFTPAAQTKWVEATANDFEKGTVEVEIPTGCTTAAAQLSCDSACTANRDCATGLSCIGGYCRDSRCPADEFCSCSDYDVAAATGDTELYETGFDQTMAFTLLGLLFVLGGGQLVLSYRESLRDRERE
jgi:hypothetical protein